MPDRIALRNRISELEISKMFTEKILDSSNDVIAYFEPLYNDDVIEDFVIKYVNNRIVDIASLDTNEMIGKRWLEYDAQNLENGAFEKVKDCFSTGESFNYAVKYVFGDQLVWFSSRVVKLEVGVVMFLKDISKEKDYEKQLLIQNKLLLEAEHVASTGSFRWDLNNGTLNLSENVFRLLGYEPFEMNATLEGILKFVHKNDINWVKGVIEESRKTKERIDITFKIITKKQELKYVNTIGEYYPSEDNWYVVGVFKDVTQQIEHESLLQSKNAELKKSNADLEAFNRIASHDLQEPLRKIQMFISRLHDEEHGTLGPRSQNYLNKVISSTERMRNLISNLLSYSRIEEVKDKPSKIDLNEIFTNVLEDLSGRIDETDASIISDKLPEVNGVLFQMEQLFSNLIGNALKYIEANRTPVIKVKCSSVVVNSFNQIPKLKSGTYHRLDFIDNGIGFENEYGDKIFEIFQRLHGKTEYSGTGLGLAICKKIVEAHNGTISAKGKIDEGAVFTVYLPSLS
ncbi:ATP-binding protein [Maribacter sp. PR1]|uniref:histidine kinase n=1 Tax=Maribacter cobaltidurans TaxID=1178778 RepID=A0ABU7ITS5_9FLAO|nr:MULTISPECIES: ATP-binding protein [Maribacter]MDC6388999.1 ATP-binding protein [Maribacter sp. PR1]MEE1976387.1 ATP-binding protein [Maribacter cobaltidurans]